MRDERLWHKYGVLSMDDLELQNNKLGVRRILSKKCRTRCLTLMVCSYKHFHYLSVCVHIKGRHLIPLLFTQRDPHQLAECPPPSRL